MSRKMSCEVYDIAGTSNFDEKSEENLPYLIVSELMSDIIENALNIAEEFAAKQYDAPTDEIMVHVNHPTVKKESEHIDLVRNSKLFYEKMITFEPEGEERDSKSEILKVYDLDCKDQPFKVKKETTEEIPMSQSDFNKILKAPKEDDGMQPSTSTEQNPKKSNGSSFMKRMRAFKFPRVNLKKSKWNIGGRFARLVTCYQKQQTDGRRGRHVNDDPSLQTEE